MAVSSGLFYIKVGYWFYILFVLL